MDLLAALLGQRPFQLRMLAKGHAYAGDAARQAADLGEALLQLLGKGELPGLGDGGQGRRGVALAGAAADVGGEGLRPVAVRLTQRRVNHSMAKAPAAERAPRRDATRTREPAHWLRGRLARSWAASR